MTLLMILLAAFVVGIFIELIILIAIFGHPLRGRPEGLLRSSSEGEQSEEPAQEEGYPNAGAIKLAGFIDGAEYPSFIPGSLALKRPEQLAETLEESALSLANQGKPYLRRGVR